MKIDAPAHIQTIKFPGHAQMLQPHKYTLTNLDPQSLPIVSILVPFWC